MAPKSAEQFEEIRSNRRAEIKDVALHVFAEEGYHNTSVSKIAKEAGVSKGLMYNYFESKEELLTVLVLEMMDMIIPNLHLPENPEDFDEAKFIEVLDYGLNLVENDPQYWKLYFAILNQPDAQAILFPKMMKKGEPMLAYFMSYFTRKFGDKAGVMMRYFSAVHDGVKMHIMLDPTTFPVKEVRELIIKQFAS